MSSINEHPFAPFMRSAIKLAERGRWNTAPNPTVGAVLVYNGHIVAEGWHQQYGGPHAEVNCLADAKNKGIDPSKCTLVVTLEPCNHTGKTPPCTKAILEAGIKHVVIGMRDPNPVASGGLEFLTAHGVHVETGIEAHLCQELIADFLTWQKQRPFVILKMASTIDGHIATRTGHSKWISCSESRREVHELRSHIGLAGGAVLIGGTTFINDNPQLTARDVAVKHQPIAVVMSSHLPNNKNYFLLQERPLETVFFTTIESADSHNAEKIRSDGVRVIGLDSWHTPQSLTQALQWLFTEAQCRYILCEGGGTLGLSLLEAGLVDEWIQYLSPQVLGDTEAPLLFNGRSPLIMSDALQMRITSCQMVGNDCRLILKRAR